MADGAELVKMKLTFWHKGKVPGDVVEVRREDVPSWRGFAVPLEDEATTEAAKTEDTTAAAKPSTTTAKAK